MHTVVAVDTVLELETECLPEFLVLFSVVAQHLFQFAADSLFNALGNDFELTVVLEKFTRNIEREVVRIHKTLYKAEIVGKKICALVHDENAV